MSRPAPNAGAQVAAGRIQTPRGAEASPSADDGAKKRKNFGHSEDCALMELVSKYGQESWKVIAANMPGRTERQCRDRYKTYLDPSVKKSPWTEEEDRELAEMYSTYGSKWSFITRFFKGRSYNNVKNRWYKHVGLSVDEGQSIFVNQGVRTSSIFGDLDPIVDAQTAILSICSQ